MSHQQQQHPALSSGASLQSTTTFATSNSPQAMNKIKVVAGYALHQKLGSGSFAVVYKGVRMASQTSEQTEVDVVAIKAITRTSEKLTKKVLQNLEVEIQILRTYRHRNIVCLHDVQKTERHFYLILEYCAGGDVQKLIRSRKAGRLTEGLTRRLMRDLSAGLKFLWGQELIHRDIKPQNLLLTGPLPLDEVNDPERLDEQEQKRQEENFPSEQFALKIADFGFARHLQTTSLAETLCGSPLYMAPEILQQNRYDAKADLWSVGTVLFEMITGRPPFNGENHIDLLRNIQRKAVRLPPDVKVTKECVNLLRLLLNRNPMSRAGFNEFFQACDAFVALGCQGFAPPDVGTCHRPNMDLGTIPENDGGSPSGSDGASLITIQNVPPPPPPPPTCYDYDQGPNSAVVTPSLGPSPSPSIPISLQPSVALTAPQARNRPLQPLVPSPPATSASPMTMPRGLLIPPQLDHKGSKQSWAQPSMDMNTTRRNNSNSNNTGNNALQQQEASSEENSFVMVEHGSFLTPNISTTGAMVSTSNDSYRRGNLEQSPPSSPAYFLNRNTPLLSSRGEYLVVKQPKGMLSTSPGTGGALMNMLSGRNRLANDTVESSKQIDSKIASATKMLAAAEDVGRRAISVAHLGDQRAYAAMRLLLMSDSSASMISATPMDGIEEEGNDGAVTDDSSSTEIIASVRRRRSSSATDKSMLDAKPDDEADEMPFAVSAESSPLLSAGIPTRESTSMKGTSMSGSKAVVKPTPAIIRLHFSEALSCYVKALTMLKGAVAAAQRVAKDIESLSSQILTAEQIAYFEKLKKRCHVTATWLGQQFKGVLDRGDATNIEISKLANIFNPQERQEMYPIMSVEELIYNHALSFGREGAVKQLLGQHEAARASYRTAGLLAETLLMETGMGSEDRKILEDYVDGFAARITELDHVMLQQSRMAGSSAAGSLASSKRVPPVVGLVGQTFASFSLDPRSNAR